MGRRLRAACAEVSTLVTLFAWSVAAAVIMIASAIKLEMPMPTKVSDRSGAGLRALFGSAFQNLAVRHSPDILRFLRCLPEEKVWADCGAEHRDHGGQVILIPMNRREDKAGQSLAPIPP